MTAVATPTRSVALASADQDGQTSMPQTRAAPIVAAADRSTASTAVVRTAVRLGAHAQRRPREPCSLSVAARRPSLHGGKRHRRPDTHGRVEDVAFNGLALAGAPGRVMTPRPASERLVAAVVARLGEHAARVADVGTGSGAIAVAIASTCPQIEVWATDTSPCAVALARERPSPSTRVPRRRPPGRPARPGTRSLRRDRCQPALCRGRGGRPASRAPYRAVCRRVCRRRRPRPIPPAHPHGDDETLRRRRLIPPAPPPCCRGGPHGTPRTARRARRARAEAIAQRRSRSGRQSCGMTPHRSSSADSRGRADRTRNV
jgi:hypothetical protein